MTLNRSFAWQEIPTVEHLADDYTVDGTRNIPRNLNRFVLRVNGQPAPDGPTHNSKICKRAETVYGGVYGAGHAGRPAREGHLIAAFTHRRPKVEGGSRLLTVDCRGLRGSGCLGCLADAHNAASMVWVNLALLCCYVQDEADATPVLTRVKSAQFCWSIFKWMPLLCYTSLPARPLNHAPCNRTVWTGVSREWGWRASGVCLQSLSHKKTSRTRDRRSPSAIEFHTLRLAKGLTERHKRCIPSRAGANHSTCISHTVLVVKSVRRAAPE